MEWRVGGGVIRSANNHHRHNNIFFKTPPASPRVLPGAPPARGPTRAAPPPRPDAALGSSASVVCNAELRAAGPGGRRAAAALALSTRGRGTGGWAPAGLRHARAAGAAPPPPPRRVELRQAGRCSRHGGDLEALGWGEGKGCRGRPTTTTPAPFVPARTCVACSSRASRTAAECRHLKVTAATVFLG